MKKVVMGLILILCVAGSVQAEGGRYAQATFAGGCFWCMEPPFEKLEGVVSVTAGYSGGDEVNPTYKQVSSGMTGHAESVQVLYDPAVVSYEQLLMTFWQSHDPTTLNRSFNDVGKQYRSAIFYHNEDQRILAGVSKKKLDESKRYDSPIVTEIAAFKVFYPAEDNHQDYHKTHPLQYKLYRAASGRDRHIQKIWGDVLKK